MVTKPTWEPMVLENLTGSPQDPVWHAEGDVATHTRMVLWEMMEHPDFQKQTEMVQDLLYRTALLHDIGKPACMQREAGRIRNHGHSRKGATLETGLVVQVPLFIVVGDVLRIDTRTGEYVTRV